MQIARLSLSSELLTFFLRNDAPGLTESISQKYDILNPEFTLEI